MLSRQVATATASASENWPASSTNSRSNASRCSCRANSHAVPATSWWSAVTSALFGSAMSTRAVVARRPCRRPSNATPARGRAARPRRSRFWIAAWLGAVMPTRRPARSAATIMRAPRKVLPVPGGPWTGRTERSSVSVAATRASVSRAAGERGGSRRSSARAAAKRPSPASSDAASSSSASRWASAPIGFVSISARGSGGGRSPRGAGPRGRPRPRRRCSPRRSSGPRRRRLPSRNSCGGKRSVQSSDRLTGSGGIERVELEQPDRVALVDELLRRLAAQVEVAPPPRLALAAVVEQQVGEQLALGVVGAERGAISASTSGSHAGGGRAAPRARARRSSAKSTPNSAAASARIALQQPVAQRERRAAVLLVVGADRLEQLVVAVLEPRLVGDDRAAALADRASRGGRSRGGARAS